MLPIALLVLALLAGCGGDDDSPQTQAGFIADADAACESLAVEFEEAGARQPRTPQEVGQANNVLADLYGRLAARIDDVRLPERAADRRRAERYVASVRRAVPLLDDLRTSSSRFVAAANENDARALATAGNEVRRALDSFRAARAESDRLAIDLGLNVCGNLG
jgi:hypothetical protein